MVSQVVECPRLVLQKKIQCLKLIHKDWNKNVFENIHKAMEDHKKSLASIKLDIARSFSPRDISNLLAQEKSIYEALNKSLDC